jgi:hypothetical protein
MMNMQGGVDESRQKIEWIKTVKSYYSSMKRFKKINKTHGLDDLTKKENDLASTVEMINKMKEENKALKEKFKQKEMSLMPKLSLNMSKTRSPIRS